MSKPFNKQPTPERGWIRSFGIALLFTALPLFVFGASSAHADDAATASTDDAPAAVAVPTDLPGIVAAFADADFDTKSALIDQLSKLQDAHARLILQALLDGHLESRSSDSAVFIVAEQGDALKLTNPSPASRPATARPTTSNASA